jgi:hypothetical protein
MTGAVRSLDLMAVISRSCAVVVVGELVSSGRVT